MYGGHVPSFGGLRGDAEGSDPTMEVATFSLKRLVNNPFTAGNPFLWTLFLGFSIGRGLGGFKGVNLRRDAKGSDPTIEVATFSLKRLVNNPFTTGNPVFGGIITWI